MNQPLYKIIQENIRTIIAENRDKQNFMLPSENQLAMKLKVSRVSIRKALAEMEQTGEIYKVKGKGSFVSEPKPSLPEHTPTTNDFFVFICPDFSTKFPREIARGIFDCTMQHGINIINICTYGSTQKEEAAIDMAKNLNCKGIIIMPSDEDNYNNAILSLTLNKFPTVLVDRTLFGLSLPCVSSDHFQIGFEAAEFLVKSHKNVCMISLNDIVSSIKLRIEGFNQSLASHHLHHPHHLIFKSNSTIDEIKQYFSERSAITGIVCNSGHIFYSVIEAMTKIGKVLNRDYEIITIDDDYKDINKALKIQPTAIVQNNYQIGYEAAEMLIQNVYHNIAMKNITIPLINSIRDVECKLNPNII